MFSRLNDRRGVRVLGVLFVAAVFVLGVAAAPASADSGRRVIKVMTYNMDAGTDFGYFFTPGYDLQAAAAATIAEVEADNFVGRAGLLADKIRAEKPDLVSLQEVTIWDFVLTETGARVDLVADQLDLLTAALKKRHLPYMVVAVQWLTNLQLPLGNGTSFHFLDRNVILARTDCEEGLELSNCTIGELPGGRDAARLLPPGQRLDVGRRELTRQDHAPVRDSPGDGGERGGPDADAAGK